MKALVVSKGGGFSWLYPQLLNRCGFVVDVLTPSKLLERSVFVRTIFPATEDNIAQDLVALMGQQRNAYDWIILVEDELFPRILDLDISDDLKLKILPVMAQKNFRNLYSKIGLAKTLEANKVLVPEFAIVTRVDEAVLAANDIGYPVLIKIDSSGGGTGTFECADAHDIRCLTIFNGQSLLLQKKIIGEELDLSALYFEGKLIHFNYAVVEKSIYKFGPSAVRRYLPMRAVNRDVFAELQKIGEALGAHCFVNIACIQTSDNKRYYFEADLRANAWADFSTFVGDDLAPRIKRWFENKICLTFDDATPVNHPKRFIRIPYFLRLSNFELLTNRYWVWKYIPWQDTRLVLHLLWKKLVDRQAILTAKRKAVGHIFRVGRIFVPKKYRPRVKGSLARIGVC